MEFSALHSIVTSSVGSAVSSVWTRNATESIGILFNLILFMMQSWNPAICSTEECFKKRDPILIAFSVMGSG